MPRSVNEFNVGSSPQDTLTACRSVASTERWTVRSETPNGIVLHRGYRLSWLTSWPLTLDVTLTPTPGGPGTMVHVAGRIFGYGPIQKGHLRRATEKLQHGLGA
jgi:hypothetical protein